MRALSVLTNAQELIVVTLWTIAQWLSVIITNWLILRVFGLPFGFKETILMMSFGLVGSLVPTPGGAAGAFHAAVSGGLISRGSQGSAGASPHESDLSPHPRFRGTPPVFGS